MNKCLIRRFNTSDQGEISYLYQKFFKRNSQEFEALWQWQFVINPNVKDKLPEKLVLEKDGKVVGFIGGFPLQLKLENNIYTVLSSANFMVDPNFPGRGVDLAKNYFDLPGMRLTLSAGETAARLLRILGAKTISGKRIIALKVYCSRKILSELANNRKFAAVFKNNKILDYISKLCDFILKFRDKLLLKAAINGIQIREITQFNEDFDLFWKDVSSNYRNIFVRNKEYLNWRFFQAPFEMSRVFAAYNKNNQLKGYIVTVTVVKKNIYCGKIVDYLVPADDDKIIAALIHYALKNLKTYGVDLVYSELFTDEFRAAFLSCGFWLFSRSRPNPIWIKDNSRLNNSEDFTNRNNWFYTGSEGDGFSSV